MAKASRIIVIDINNSKFDLARRLGATDCINPKDYDKPIQEVIVELTDKVDYSFECIGNVDVMQSALECCHKGWGESVVSVAELAFPPARSSSLPVGLKGSAFGGQGRSELPGIERYLQGDQAEWFHHPPRASMTSTRRVMHEGKAFAALSISTRMLRRPTTGGPHNGRQ